MLSNGNISLNPSVLRNQSKQLDNLSKSYEGFYQKVEAEFGSINANWGSDLVANFVDKITKFKSTETELIESLRLAAKKAEAAACLYEQADASLKTSDVASIENPQTIIDKYGINGKIENMKHKKGFRNGEKSCKENEYYMTNWVKEHNGVELHKSSMTCVAMARMMQIEVYGKEEYSSVVEIPSKNIKSINDVKIGDVLHMHYKQQIINKKGEKEWVVYDHTVFITDVKDGKIVFSEGNYAPVFGAEGEVHHGREILANQIVSFDGIERVNL